MFPRFTLQRSKLRRAAYASLRWGMIWVLCLCAWRGPVPVFHCHELNLLSLANDAQYDSASAGWQLAEHLAKGHGHAHERGEHAGWHVHFVLPTPVHGNHDGENHSGSDQPLNSFLLTDLVTHGTGHELSSAPVTLSAWNVLADFAGPYSQPSLSPTVPKLIPLAPPRQRPSRVSPRIYYCVAQC